MNKYSLLIIISKENNLEWVPEPVEISFPDDRRDGLEDLDVVSDLQQLHRRGGGQVQLVAEGAAHRHQGARANASVVACDVVGHRGHVRPDAAGGIGQRRAVLDLHAHQRVGVVRAPDLRAVVEHARVEAPS